VRAKAREAMEKSGGSNSLSLSLSLFFFSFFGLVALFLEILEGVPLSGFCYSLNYVYTPTVFG
jgi:hypothetical protein